MDSKAFIEIYNKTLKTLGFEKHGKFFIKNLPLLTLRFSLQRSAYSLGYYINIDMFANELERTNQEILKLRADINKRVWYSINGNGTDFFDLENISNENEAYNLLLESLTREFEWLNDNGIRGYLSKSPFLVKTINMDVREFIIKYFVE